MKERVYRFRLAMFDLLFIDYVFVANISSCTLN